MSSPLSIRCSFLCYFHRGMWSSSCLVWQGHRRLITYHLRLGASSVHWISVRFTFLPVAAGMLLRDPSGVTFKVESILIISCLGSVGVRCPHGVEYCLGISSLGSPLLHSFLINVWASSKATKLGVMLGSAPEQKAH